MDDSLRNSLVKFVKIKFSTYPNIINLADDIVHEAYISLLSSKKYSKDKENFGYLSVVSIRLAYRQFMSQSMNHLQLTLDIPNTILISEEDFVSEILAAEKTEIILKTIKLFIHKCYHRSITY